MPTVSIILLNYNGKQFNIPCIQSLLAQSYQDFEILFVDNASTDGSLEEVEQSFQREIHHGKIKIIKNSINTGFTGGNNLGYLHATGTYVCLLNNDTTVDTYWLEALIQGIKSDSSLGAIGSIVLDRGYEQEIQDMIFKKHKKGILTHVEGFDFVSLTQEEITGPIFYVGSITGCSLLFKKEIINHILFPDFYFAYGEDTFLCNRILLQGYRLALAKKSIVYHYGSGSFGKKPTLKKIARGSANLMINVFLFHKGKDVILLFPILLLYHFLNCFYDRYFLKRMLGKMLACVLVIKDIPRIIALKKHILSEKNIPFETFYKHLSYKIIDEFYVPAPYKHFIRIVNACVKQYFRLFRIPFYEERLQTPKH